MIKAVCRNIGGWLIAGVLIVGCQSTAPPAAEAGDIRTVDHAKGTSQVPRMPQRVVVLDTAPLAAAIALGIKPVGTIVYGQLPKYLGDEVSGITPVGDGNQPSFEAILQLNPDLILGSKPGNENLYSQLSQIAPTVLAEDSGRAGDWPQHFRLYAEALGRSEQAEQLLQSYQEQVETFRQQLDQPADMEISLLASYDNKIGAYTTGSFPGSVLQDIGFARNPAQNTTRRYALQLSQEALTKLDGDFIFLIYSSHFPGVIKIEEFIADPIWSQLKAVQQNRVCEVPNEVWIAGRSILAAQQILVDVGECLNLEQLD
mgnify:FL=1